MPLSKAKQVEYMRQYRKRNGAVSMLSTREKKLKERVFDLLGRQCVVCGFKHPFALQIDHMGNNGKEDRLKYTSNPSLYAHIIEVNGVGYQVLCANCNIIKYHFHRSHCTLGDGRWENYVARHRKRGKVGIMPTPVIPNSNLEIEDNVIPKPSPLPIIQPILRPYSKEAQLIDRG